MFFSFAALGKFGGRPYHRSPPASARVVAARMGLSALALRLPDASGNLALALVGHVARASDEPFAALAGLRDCGLDRAEPKDAIGKHVGTRRQCRR